VIGVAAASGIGCTSSFYNRVDAHGAFLRKTVRDETTSAGIAAPEWTTEPVEAGTYDAAPGPPTEAPSPNAETTPMPPPPAPAEESGCAFAGTARSHGYLDAWSAVVAAACVAAIRRHRRRALRLQ
jgi:hypothetical protein